MDAFVAVGRVSDSVTRRNGPLKAENILREALAEANTKTHNAT